MRQGVTRLVLLIGKYAIKIPNFTYSHQNFLSGCLANHNERLFCKQYKGMPQLDKVAYTYYSSLFGLLNIQRRAEIVPFDISSDRSIRESFRGVCHDFKNENFGFINDKIVCIDYA